MNIKAFMKQKGFLIKTKLKVWPVDTHNLLFEKVLVKKSTADQYI